MEDHNRAHGIEPLDFSVGELQLIIEALERAASRHESMARFNPRHARPHDEKASAMRRLRNRLLRTRMEAA